MLYEIYFLGLLGTFAFAIFGAYKGIEKEFDIFGIFVSSFLSSVGGGTLVSLTLDKRPAFFTDNSYMYIIIAGIVFTLYYYQSMPKLTRYIMIVDAIGLSAFALVGADYAANAGLGLVGTIFLAVTMSVGGGLLRDIVIGDVPQIFYSDFYATPAIILATLYYFSGSYRQSPLIVYFILILAFIIRLVAIYYKINIWRPWLKE